MSYMYKHFGEGFDVVLPSPEALRFEELVQLRGVDVVLIHLTFLERDSYGHPVYSETAFTVKAVVRKTPSELRLPPGEVKQARVEALLPAWAPVDEEQCDLVVDGNRYHVTGIEDAEAYLKIYAERTVP
jgi:hypothetical protein